MEANQEAPQEKSELTAKQMAAAEEVNAARLKGLMDAEQKAAEEGAYEPMSILGLAAQGREALLEGLRQHAERTAVKEYIPPPRTARQMSQLEEELEAGRRSQQRAEAQQAARPVDPTPPNEGFTTPVHRPGDFVPNLNSRDPAIK